MNVASLELCRELYMLSRWGKHGEHTPENATHYWLEDMDEVRIEHGGDWMPKDGGIYPAYDLGYLLRKLPPKPLIKAYDQTLELAQLSIWQSGNKKSGYYWIAGYDWPDGNSFSSFNADTPENATCKLAIELFKQGVVGRPANITIKE